MHVKCIAYVYFTVECLPYPQKVSVLSLFYTQIKGGSESLKDLP